MKYKKVFRVILTFIICFALLEGVFRLMGYQTFDEQYSFSFESKPSNYLTPDPVKGIVLAPGEFAVTINHHHSYSCTHTPNSTRSTGCRPNRKNDRSLKIEFHGCSFTYGMGVNDAETYPYLIQQKYPDLEIINHGVPGYGQMQCLVDLDKHLEESNADYLIMNYMTFHDQRNSMNAIYKSVLLAGFKDDTKTSNADSNFPYGVLENGKLRTRFAQKKDFSTTIPFTSHLVLMNLINNIINDKSINEKEEQRVTKAIISEINKTCKKHGAQLIITHMNNYDSTHEVLQYCKKLNIETIDIVVEYQNKKYNNAPYDMHPNSAAHKLFAEKLTPFFDRLSSQHVSL